MLRSQEGFTLIEVLVVVITIGILAAIAMPAFLGQQNNARDASAKTLARTAYSAIETTRTETGSYAVTRDALVTIEPSLTNARDLAVSAADTSYRLELRSSDGGRSFWIERAPTGALQRGCTPAGAGGCPDDGSW